MPKPISPFQVRGTNKLLARLPCQVYENLSHHCKTVLLSASEVLLHPDQLADNVYFPVDGAIANVVNLGDGDSLGVGLVGQEGMVELSVFLGCKTIGRWLTLIPGAALQMPRNDFRASLEQFSTFSDLVKHYSEFYYDQQLHSVACHSLHSIENRCCFWLLMMHLGTNSKNPLLITHEDLAHLLSVRRASVTQIAQVLQNHGIIHYSHGKLAILDLTGLEARACGCFAKMKERYDRAVGKIDFGFCKPSFSQR